MRYGGGSALIASSYRISERERVQPVAEALIIGVQVGGVERPVRLREVGVGLRLADQLRQHPAAGGLGHHLGEGPRLVDQVGADVAGVGEGGSRLDSVEVPVERKRALRRPPLAEGGLADVGEPGDPLKGEPGAALGEEQVADGTFIS